MNIICWKYSLLSDSGIWNRISIFCNCRYGHAFRPSKHDW